MNPSDYRRDYAAYFSAFERERFARHADLGRASELARIEERYADLWTRGSVEDLLRAHDETPEQFETERAGLLALAGAARLKYAEWCARDVTDELRGCLDSSRVDWDGERVASYDVPFMLAEETDAGRRRELAHRWLDAVSACDDLRAARLEALGAAARGLGFENRRALYESLTGADVASLTAASKDFLERTESDFMSRLARWASRELPIGSGPEYADQLFFVRAARFDARFASRDFVPLYSETLKGLGVNVGSQRNLSIDDAPRTSKGARTLCFAVSPPEDVRLVVGAREGGLDFQRESFREGARAQVFAWASRETATRHPEFVRAPDAATEEGHALFLSGLFAEREWLTARRGMRANETEETAGFAALLELHDARRDCAALAYAHALDATGDARSEQLREEYVSLLTGATGFRHAAATRLLDADVWFASATRLRARLFAAGMREHMRSRHGRRWFASRSAGDELVDVWNTASRYRVEELAQLVWGGELSFDLLADESVAALGVGDGAG